MEFRVITALAFRSSPSIADPVHMFITDKAVWIAKHSCDVIAVVCMALQLKRVESIPLNEGICFIAIVMCFCAGRAPFTADVGSGNADGGCSVLKTMLIGPSLPSIRSYKHLDLNLIRIWSGR